MLKTRYTTRIDFPGVPAGEVMEKITGEHAYRGTVNKSFWMGDAVVEADAAAFALSGIVTVVNGIEEVKFLAPK